MQTKLVLKQRSALKLRFQLGATGPAGTISVGTVTTGAPGTDVIVTNVGTPENAILNFTIPEGEQGIQGLTGNKGWSPAFAIVTDGARRVLQVDDWVGGEGVKPATGDYVGATGLTPTIGDAVDIRGPAGTATIPDGNKGDITTADSGNTWTIENEAVSNAKLANMATGTIKGRTTAGTGDPEDLTATQATALLNAVVGDSGSGGTKGLVPAPSAGDAAAGKVLGAGGGWIAGAGALGQCCLVKSGSNIVLQPFSGNLLSINGKNQTIPSAGVSLAPSGLTPSALYYIYAYMNGGTMTLEASTTGHATSATTGVEIKSGDATRSLVGAVRPVTGPAFADTEAQRFVASWFNAPEVTLRAQVTATQTTTSTTFVEFTTSLRVEFVALSRLTPKVAITGLASNSAGAVSLFAAGYDGISVVSEASGYAGASLVPMTHNDARQLSEGYHYVTVVGAVSAASTASLAGALAYPVIIPYV